ncbi:hypothetical protein HanHA300_Chr06g0215781 [Helianthus annuus]|nr:hypothetical protein HanHA300_Chr06g0215781 [Helianthus annuus]KAJ0567265.1 hypothetical protein HanIR_Chr06g0282841 [Helianthus annuus]KAJ0573863.1 hypothetical protein HanHA89_Chr06g0231561 [Helianthus annuus]KAJ0738199.1 hypothetical protein HanLR1_Chr06g0215501 [Helianthus annuus]KAJ0741093.1 hypothetical protein HanOQP8_Chr06g0224091 [Helianthus annuus]
MLFGRITIVGGIKGTSATDFIINRMSSNDKSFSHVVLLLTFQLFLFVELTAQVDDLLRMKTIDNCFIHDTLKEIHW